MCFYRAMAGWSTLLALDIPATPVLGGMVYRAGPDERRDVVAFCGPGNVGFKSPYGILAHYFIVSGNDIIDFSVGDWKQDAATLPEFVLPGQSPLGPVRWTAPPPDFFWADRSAFAPDPSAFTPELGRAWYTGFAGQRPDFEELIEDFVDSGHLRSITPHIQQCIEQTALRERLFAVRNGHTAVRFSQLANLVGDPALMAKARQNERLVVLRG